jgi:hypothetical protein
MLALGYSLLIYTPVLGIFVVVFLFAVKRPIYFLLFILVFLALASSTAPWFNFLNGTVYKFGFHIYMVDVLSFIALLATMFDYAALEKKIEFANISYFKLISKVMLALTLIGIFFWKSNYGLASAVNSWREPLYDSVFLFYGLNKYAAWTKKGLQFLLIAPGVILGIITIIRISMVGIGYSAGVDPNTGQDTGRATNAVGSFIILFAVFGAYFLMEKVKILKMCLISIGLLLILVLQHRTVWISAIVGSVAIIISNEKNTNRMNRTAKIMIFGTLSGLLYMAVNVVAPLHDSATNTNTYGWRTSRWIESMSTNRSLTQWIFGSIFGPSPVTQIGLHGQLSHSAYVNEIEYFGFFGLSILLFFFLLGIKKFRRVRDNSLLGKTILLAGISYGYSYTIAMSFFCVVPVLLSLYDKQIFLELNSESIKKQFKLNRE